MKTAISVPDETHERVERLAKQHGLNRSQFYATAADRYADELESADLTAAINTVADAAYADESTKLAVTAGRRVLEGGVDEW